MWSTVNADKNYCIYTYRKTVNLSLFNNFISSNNICFLSNVWSFIYIAFLLTNPALNGLTNDFL